MMFNIDDYFIKIPVHFYPSGPAVLRGVGQRDGIYQEALSLRDELVDGGGSFTEPGAGL